MPEYYAAFNKENLQLSIREKTFNTTPFEPSKSLLVMGPFEAGGKWDAAAKARDHFIKEIKKYRREKDNE